ncbi:hypothetical protein CYY_004567 [Polysphondylium violaceum]|uniref:Uncharacterized protein n=1 Tax=Polysphondylium violaceum TaxID=133409 RepID=A0A8J4PV37_9MYCE|nr:hypothetical protein CYY_004567 [Polysphondylium violaceum]
MSNQDLFTNAVVYKSTTTPNRTFQCIIDHQDDEKYVILRLTPYDTTTNSEAIEDRWVLASTETEAYHSDIKNWYCSNTADAHKNIWRSPVCMGGGIIKVDHENKTVKTWGTSGGYGDPPLEIVEQILKTVYEPQGYQLDIKITDEVRELIKPKHRGYWAD